MVTQHSIQMLMVLIMMPLLGVCMLLTIMASFDGGTQIERASSSGKGTEPTETAPQMLQKEENYYFYCATGHNWEA